MIKGRKVITLCGSSAFKDDFVRVNGELSLKGNVVITLAIFGHADNIPLTSEQKALLDEIHLRKIDLSDEIYIINKGGKIGSSTRKEIEYARANGKGEKYLEPNKPLPRQGPTVNTT